MSVWVGGVDRTRRAGASALLRKTPVSGTAGARGLAEARMQARKPSGVATSKYARCIAAADTLPAWNTCKRTASLQGRLQGSHEASATRSCKVRGPPQRQSAR